jgi:hypothetical protein
MPVDLFRQFNGLFEVTTYVGLMHFLGIIRINALRTRLFGALRLVGY